MSGQIFISYRREESRWSAGRLYDRLCARFDRKQVFMDIDAIALGDDFVKAIEKTVGECDVLIAVIGAHWLTSKDEQDSRRLDNPEDFVRMEIGTALRRDIRVIPVLVDGALMPRPTDLPDDLKALVRRNALRISDTGFEDDCRRLLGAIEQVLEKNAAERREREEKERLEHEPQAQPPSPVAPSPPPAKSEAANPSAETPKVVYPLPPKPAEPEREKPPPPSAGGTGGKSPSKQIIVSLTIAAVLVVGGLIYLAFKASQSPPPQLAPIVAVTPSPPVPTVEEKAPPTPEVAVQASAQPTAPVAVAVPSPSISATPTKEELAQASLAQAKAELDQAIAEQRKTEQLEQRWTVLFNRKIISQQEYDITVQANLAAKAKVELDQAIAEQRKTEHDEQRGTELFNKKLISQQEYDNRVQANLVAKAKVEAALASFQKAQAKAELGKAIAEQQKTEHDEQRSTELFNKKLISQQEYDNRVQANLVAKAKVEAAHAALDQAVPSPSISATPTK
jgi:TIR domain